MTPADSEKKNTAYIWLRLLRGSGVALLLLLTGYAALYVLFSYNKIIYPFPLETGEGEVLNYAAILADGRTLYAPLGPESATIVNYPPIVPMLVSAFLDPDSAPTFAAGRAMAVAFTLLATFLMAVVCLRKNTPWYIAGLAGLLFLMSPNVSPAAAVLRVDLFAIPVTFAGLVAFTASPNRSGIYAAVPIFLVAFFMKQSTIFAPMAVGLYLLVNDRRALLLFVALLGAFGGGAILIAQLVTDGELCRHLFTYTYDGYDVSRLTHYLRELLTSTSYIGGFVTAAAAALWLHWAFTGGHRDPAWYYLPTAALSLLLLGKYGSSVFYFYEFTLAVALTIGLRLGYFARENPGEWGRIVALLVVVPLIALYVNEHNYYRSDFLPRKQHIRARKLLMLIKAAKTPVFAEDVGLIVLAGRIPRYPNTYSLTAAIESGHWDPAPLLNDLAGHRIAFVYTESDVNNPNGTTQDRIHPVILDAIREHYATPIGGPGMGLYFPTGFMQPKVPAVPAEPSATTPPEGIEIPDWISPDLVVP